MKKNTFFTIAFLIACCVINISAQFNIKIPKIGKPKVEQPKTEQPKTNDDSSSTERDSDAKQNPANRSGGAVGFMPQPKPTNVPVLLKDTLAIRLFVQKTYWKFPKETFYSSWIPRVSFNIFYDQSETARYTAEWSNPDGSVWFSEPLEADERLNFIQSDPTKGLDTLTTDKIGTYKLRVFNSKTKETVFQGKFSVKKIALNVGEPRYKNLATFYAENDGNLPVGYVGFGDDTSWYRDPQPTVYMWFKGNLSAADFEARLFYNNQQILSTDDGGAIGKGETYAEQRNADSCFESPELCRYTLWNFRWKNFKVESFDQTATLATYSRDPEAIYTKDKPGEYTVKIFYKGQQVRETRFTVQPNGWLETNKFAAQIPMRNYRAVIPVKIMGTLDKWNAAVWKTDAFYGNPLTGFAAP